MHIARLTIGILAAALLASCGGGGSGSGGGGGAPAGGSSAQLPDANTLFVSVKYHADFSLFEQGTVLPALVGFEGHSPNCSLVAGSLPPGVQLRTDCALVGRPVAAGDPYPFTVRVTVAGFQGEVDFPNAVFVRSPVITYANPVVSRQALPRGALIDELPSLSGWSPAADEPPSWSYVVASGVLAPGLRLDAHSGAITGNVAEPGSFTANIQARLLTAFGSYDLPPFPFSANVDVPTFTMFTIGPTSADGTFRAFAGRPLETIGARPTDTAFATLSDFRLAPGASLPAGLALDPNSGGILGTPSALTPPQTVPIEATATVFGVSNTTTAILRLEVVAPELFAYGTGLNGSVGTPLIQTPVLSRVDPFFFGPSSQAASQREGACTLPPGISMNPLNGQMTGTPTAAGTFDCTVDFDVTVNGVTWRQPAQFLIVIN